jgi:hypothetical protein
MFSARIVLIKNNNINYLRSIKMSEKNENQEVVSNQQKEEVGLEALDDQVLADIIYYEVEDQGGLKSAEALSAFKKLCRRSGHKWAFYKEL